MAPDFLMSLSMGGHQSWQLTWRILNHDKRVTSFPLPAMEVRPESVKTKVLVMEPGAFGEQLSSLQPVDLQAASFLADEPCSAVASRLWAAGAWQSLLAAGIKSQVIATASVFHFFSCSAWCSEFVSCACQ